LTQHSESPLLTKGTLFSSVASSVKAPRDTRLFAGWISSSNSNSVCHTESDIRHAFPSCARKTTATTTITIITIVHTFRFLTSGALDVFIPLKKPEEEVVSSEVSFSSIFTLTKLSARITNTPETAIPWQKSGPHQHTEKRTAKGLPVLSECLFFVADFRLQ